MDHRARIPHRPAARAVLCIAALAGTIGFAEQAQAGTWTCSAVDSSYPVAGNVAAYYDSGTSTSMVSYTYNNPSTDYFSQLAYGSPSSWTVNQFDGPTYNAGMNTYTAGLTAYHGSLWAAYPDDNKAIRLAQFYLTSPGSAPTYHGANGSDGAIDDIADSAPSIVPYQHTDGHWVLHIFYTAVPSAEYEVHEAVWDTSTETWGTGMTIAAPAGSAASPAAISYKDASNNLTLRVFYLENGLVKERVTSNGSNANWGPEHTVSDPSVVAEYLPSVSLGAGDGLLHVFYPDSSGALRESVSDSSGNFGSTFNLVDNASGMITQGAAPVVVNGGTTLEVYYVDLYHGTLKEAAYTRGLIGSSWSVSTIDGTSGSRCGGTDPVASGISTAIVAGTTPQVYYFTSTELRVAAWSP